MFLKPKMGEVVEIRYDAISFASWRCREAKRLESCDGLLKYELDSLKRNESTGCGMEIVGPKVADAEGKVSSLLAWLRRDTFDLHASTQRNVDQTLLAIHSCL